MDKKLEALAEHLSAALSDALIAAEIVAGELCCRVVREALPRVLIFLRDDPGCRLRYCATFAVSTTRIGRCVLRSSTTS